MPRSGGHYTFISRTLHPALGFTLSLSMVVWLMATIASAATYLSTIGLTPLFSVYGQMLGSDLMVSWANALSPPAGTFIAGTIPTLIVGTLMFAAMVFIISLGTRAVFRIYWVSMITALVGSLAMVYVFFTTSQQEFITLFNSFAEVSYSGLIETAKAEGWSDQPTTLNATLAFMVWPFYPLAFSILTSSFAGEIKNVKRSQLYGMSGPVVVSATVMALIVYGAVQMMGYEFIAAAGYTFYVVPDQAMQILPWNTVFAAIATENPVLTFLVLAGGLMWSWAWIPGSLIFASRIMLAWSIDRVVPKPIGRVSTKYNSPFVAVIVAGFIAEFWLIAFTFVPVARALVAIAAITFTFATIGIAATVFPYRRPEMYENSPISEWEIAGIPFMTIVGAITTVYMLGMLWFFFTDPLVGATTTPSLVAVGGVFVLGFVIFYGMRYYRRQYQGIDIDKAFQEIPVE
jgi:APA family basic amino acid/polyamine antiporter